MRLSQRKYLNNISHNNIEVVFIMGDGPNGPSPIFYVFLIKDVKNMRVISFDQSTRVSGWSLFEDGEYVCSGVVDMSKSSLETDRRSFEMARKLWKILNEYKPDYLILEDTQQQNNVKTVITLARLQGMIIGYAEAHKIKVHILLPSAWRKALGYMQGPKVKRAELKQQSADYVKQKYGFVKSEDENEAICEGVAAHILFDFS